MYLRPSLASIGCAQDPPALADCPATLLIAEVDVKDRFGDAGRLRCPVLAAIIRVENRAAGADNPPTLFVDEVDVNQLEPARRAMSLPSVPGVVRKHQNAVDDSIASTHRANHPTLFLIRKANAVEFHSRAVKFLRLKT